MAFGLTIIGDIAATTLIVVSPESPTSPESNILGNLSLKVKKLLILTCDVKSIFKLQDVQFITK